MNKTLNQPLVLKTKQLFTFHGGAGKYSRNKGALDTTTTTLTIPTTSGDFYGKALAGAGGMKAARGR